MNSLKNILGIVIVFLFSISFSQVYERQGLASYYDDHHEGLTANGERFNSHDFTAAHPTLPYGTKVKITNLKNGKAVIVRINDRPFEDNFMIMLSQSSAQHLDFYHKGEANVQMEEVVAEQLGPVHDNPLIGEAFLNSEDKSEK